MRPHLEYGAPIWYPRLKKNITEIEKVQRRATKQIPTFKHMPYESRLRKLQLPTLRFRRLRGDMIETYKILNGIYDSSVCNLLTPTENTRTRGHSMKLPKIRASTTVKANSFTHRIVNCWNNLPEETVSAPSVNSFKNRLDALWKHHPLMYDWEAEPIYTPSTGQRHDLPNDYDESKRAYPD